MGRSSRLWTGLAFGALTGIAMGASMASTGSYGFSYSSYGLGSGISCFSYNTGFGGYGFGSYGYGSSYFGSYGYGGSCFGGRDCFTSNLPASILANVPMGTYIFA